MVLLRKLATILCLAASAAVAPVAAVAGPTLLFEPGTGKVLYAEDIDDQWHPASLTKIMTAYLTFQAIKAGKLTLETPIPYSEVAAQQPPSKIGLPVGSTITVDLALQALVVKSANDIAMVLAEAVGGTEAQFVEMMNATARQLGMTRSVFRNPHGLHAVEQVTTARDMARLAAATVRDFPEHTHYWGQQQVQIGAIRINTHNGLFKILEGADGFKTGFVCDSGFNIVASASREGVRIMAVVLGELTPEERNVRAQQLVDRGFAMREWKAMFDNGTLASLPQMPQAKDAASIRNSMVFLECQNRRIARVVAARKRAKSQAKTDVAAKKAAPAAGAQAATTANAPASVAKPATAQPKAAPTQPKAPASARAPSPPSAPAAQ